jgi:hypothetical protein
MFIGHFAIALGAKPVAPVVSLGTLFFAVQLADLLWPNFVLLGLEHFEVRPGATVVTPLEFVSYPYSHSLVAVMVWSALAAVLYWGVRRHRAGAVVVALAVLSHWLLDAVAHKPDMPLTFDGPRVGLGLWSSLPATIIVEGALFAAGLAAYVRATRAADRVGQFGFWALIVFLLAVYAANLASPPPPGVTAVAWSAQAMWLLVAWAYWVDRHRTAAMRP